MRESCVTPVRAALRGVRLILTCYLCPTLFPSVFFCATPASVRADEHAGRPPGSTGVPDASETAASTPNDAEPEVATLRAEAEPLYREGLTAIRNGHFKEAVANLDAAYRAYPAPLTMYALAFAYNGLGYPDKAVEALSAYVDLAVPAGHDPALIAEVQREIARLLAEVARFSVKLSPEALELRIDDQVIQPKDGQLWLQPGRHEIAASAPGHEPFEQGLEVRPGRFELDIQLRPLPAPAGQVALALCAEGDRFAETGDMLAAVECYERARVLRPTARAIGSTGLARAQLGEIAVAVPLLRDALAAAGDPWIKAHRGTLRAALSRAEQRLATIVLTGDATETGARVWLDGRAMGRLPDLVDRPQMVAAGTVSVRAALSGHREYRRELEIRPGDERTVALTFVPTKAGELTLELTPNVEPPAGSAGEHRRRQVEARTASEIAAAESRPFAFATGLEMSLELGYDFSLRNGLGGSAGSIAARLFSIGYRPFWPVSFGVHLLTGAMNVTHEGTQFIGAVYPGLYVRAHSQRQRRSFAVDVWGGIGFVPLSLGLVVRESRDQGVTNLDASRVDDAEDVLNSVAKDSSGISDLVTLQSYNIPLELGVSFYLTPGMALSLSSALTFYRPVQQCYFTELSGDHVCYDSDLRAQTSLYIGFGLSLLQ